MFKCEDLSEFDKVQSATRLGQSISKTAALVGCSWSAVEHSSVVVFDKEHCNVIVFDEEHCKVIVFDKEHCNVLVIDDIHCSEMVFKKEHCSVMSVAVFDEEHCKVIVFNKEHCNVMVINDIHCSEIVFKEEHCSVMVTDEKRCSEMVLIEEHCNVMISHECMEALVAQWTESQNAAIINNLNRLMDIFKKNQKSVCEHVTPKECPAPAVQSKGGIVCVSANGKRYCKPMCNEGYDFSFLRTSRLYEECSNATSFRWTTQYVGGNKLAVCNRSNIQISATSSAYFPVNQDCWVTKSNSTLEQEVINTFENELSAKNIQGPYTHRCMVCG
ncbi:hypothetical protein C0J50_1313 [Silurus asotus]|uniref:Uncharacterized protein n=1 Tax=Silurus asotus TaxID=30991 RepID=A0AAD5A8R0_SILAS|nr:hypothetical protein C0J50_1313 [Silurus asotus]